MSGPSFSGALLIPSAAASQVRGRRLTHALRERSRRAEWPQDWGPARALGQGANYGLLLRWEAALEELRAFRAVSEQDVADFLQRFANAVQSRLSEDSAFEPVPVFELDRRPLIATRTWDRIPTIFSFVLCRSESGAARLPLSREETARVFQLLRADSSGLFPGDLAPSGRSVAALRFQLGQPVACGSRFGVPVSALRLCASARLVVEATSKGELGVPAVIERALAALDKTALLADMVAGSRGRTREEELQRRIAA